MYRIILILFFPFIAFSQKELSIKECIQIAIEKNISIRQALIQEQIAKNNFSQSKKNLLPSASFDMSGGMSLGNSLNPTTYEVQFRNAYSSTLGLSAQMNLFTGLQQINNIERTKELLASSHADKETFVNNLALSVSNIYLQILLSKEIVETAINQSKLTQQQIERTEKLIEAGVIPKGNALDLKAQKARDELNIVKAQNSYDLLVFQMKQLLLIPQKEQVTFKSEMSEFQKINTLAESRLENYDVESITNNAILRMPQIKTEEYKLRAAQRQISISKGTLSPTLSFQYYSGSNFINTVNDYRDSLVYSPPREIGNVYVPQINSTFAINSLGETYKIKTPDGERPYLMQMSDNLSHRLTLSMNVPIFARFQKMTNLSNAKLQYKIQELQLEQAKNKLKEDVYTAYINYKNAEKSYYANQTNFNAFENAYNFSKEKFDAGVINSLDFSTSNNNFQNAQSELLRSKYEYFFRKMVLNFYMNGSIINE